MTALMRCPLCGASEGYESSGYIMTCCSCLRGMVVVSRTHDEDVAEWNSAGAHAQSLRDRIAVLEAAIRSVLPEFVTTDVVASGERWPVVGLRYAAPERMLRALEAALEQKP